MLGWRVPHVDGHRADGELLGEVLHPLSELHGLREPRLPVRCVEGRLGLGRHARDEDGLRAVRLRGDPLRAEGGALASLTPSAKGLRRVVSDVVPRRRRRELDGRLVGREPLGDGRRSAAERGAHGQAAVADLVVDRREVQLRRGQLRELARRQARMEHLARESCGDDAVLVGDPNRRRDVDEARDVRGADLAHGVAQSERRLVCARASGAWSGGGGG